MGEILSATGVTPQVENEIDVGTFLGKADIDRPHHIHRDVVPELVLDEKDDLLEHPQALLCLVGLEHPVELFDLVVELDFGDMGILYDLRVHVPPSLEGAEPLRIDDLLDPPVVAKEVIGDIVDPLVDQFLEDHLDEADPSISMA